MGVLGCIYMLFLNLVDWVHLLHCVVGFVEISVSPFCLAGVCFRVCKSNHLAVVHNHVQTWQGEVETLKNLHRVGTNKHAVEERGAWHLLPAAVLAARAGVKLPACEIYVCSIFRYAVRCCFG